jgi:hypothetical protein
MTEFELGWVVGILEGEGCFRAKALGRPLPTVTIQMTDRDVMARLCKAIDANLRGPYERAPPSKGYKAERLMRLVLPHMGERRSQKIEETLELWTTRKKRATEHGTPPACGHADRPLGGRGLCSPCYKKQTWLESRLKKELFG